MTDSKPSTTIATLSTTKVLSRNTFNFGRVLFGLCAIATFFTAFCDTQIVKYE